MGRSKLCDEVIDLRKCGTKSSVVLDRCNLEGSIELSTIPGEWTHIADCQLRNCSQFNVSIATAVFEDVAVEGMRRRGRSPLYLWGCVFREVTLAGMIHGMKINAEIGLSHRRSSTLQHAWTQAAVTFYENASWALDIREAHFSSVPTFEAVPGNRILIDSSRQAVVRREALAGQDVRSLPRGTALDWFLRRSPFGSVVLASSSTSERRESDLDDLSRLRDLGIADPAN